ncbi:MAG: hypothetical protein O6829_07865 [Alphaproteobacteria bacterium]|nr:hypothetical protein [Alphaproteobacteria bacterium]MCZ6607541.1 hypothetical protein [Alphaproteobacteria bacterium]
MTEQMCPIWGTPATLVSDGDKPLWDSPRAGGQYILTGTASGMLGGLSDHERVRLTTWIIDQNRLGSGPPFIDSTQLKAIKAYPDLSVMERQDRLLMYLEKRINRIGEQVEIRGSVTDVDKRTKLELLAWTASVEPQEVYYLVEACEKAGLIWRPPANDFLIHLTTQGYRYLSDLGAKRVASDQAFVAMWFNSSMEEAYENGFSRAIRDSMYKPMRIDRKEHVNRIDDEIIAEIRRSRFLVADFTSEPEKPRGGVYFEAGYAYGLNIPVIWTCRKDFIDQIHFDTRQFNHIDWSDPDDLYKRLKNRIGAVIGDGPLKADE